MLQKFKIVLFSLPLLALLGLSPATAAFTTLFNGSFGATTGTWGAQLATPSGTGSTSAYSINWNGNGNKQYELVSLINVGALNLISARISFSSAKPNGDTTNAPTLIFESCPGTWNLSTAACSETVTAFGSGSSGTVVLNFPTTPNSRAIFRINSGKAGGGGAYVTTLNALTSRIDVRPALIRHS